MDWFQPGSPDLTNKALLTSDIEKNHCMFQFSTQGFGSMIYISVNDAAYVAFHICLKSECKIKK